MKNSQAVAKDRLTRRLAAYALAAGAALALPQAAGAEIVCGNIDMALGVGDSHGIDLDGNGNDEIVFSVEGSVATSSSSFFYFSAKMAVTGSSLEVLVSSSSNDRILNQPTSGDIPPSSGYWSASHEGYMNAGSFANGSSSLVGNFDNGIPGYIAIRFQVADDEYQYGWIEYTADNNFDTAGGTIGRWAYETEVNRPITPGDTGTCGQVGPGPDPDPGPAPNPTPGQPQIAATNNGGCFISAGSE